MKAGRMPAQAITNGLELMPLPKELSSLCDLELQLLAQVIAFQKIVGLRGGAYQGVKGQSVYVPIDTNRVSQTVTTLPRKLTNSGLIPLKLKRRLRFDGYVMYQCISRFGVDIASDWLIKNNPFFKHIKKDPNWHVLDPNDPDDQLLLSLLKKDEDVPNDIELHEEENDDQQDKVTPKKETEEEVYEGKGLLYDTVLVDNIPSLPEQSPTFPVREDGNAFAIAPGEGQTPISRRTENLNQLAFPGMFPYGEC